MKKIKLILGLFMLSLLFNIVLAENNTFNKCKPDFELLNLKEPFSLEDYGKVINLIGNNKVLFIEIGNSKFYYLIKDKSLSMVDEIKYDVKISIEPCSLERILNGADPIKEYELGNIKISSVGLIQKFKTGFGKVLFKIYSWFS